MTHNVSIIAPDFASIHVAAEGTTLLQALRDEGLADIHAPCGGAGRCGKCRVRASGELTPPTGAEIGFLGEGELSAGMRLACQSRILGDVELRIDGMARASILTTGRTAGFPMDVRAEGGVGAGVDLGTTTIVVHLVDLRSGVRLASLAGMNAQRVYGEDVIARIDASVEREDGLSRLQALAAGQIASMIAAALERAHIPREALSRIVVAGNPTMLHLLAGVSPRGIAAAPFTPAFTERRTLTAGSLGMEGLPGNAAVILLPGVSGYVGADIVAGIAASGMSRERETALYLDLGTNGEIALGDADRILCCAAAAGPAFDGGGFAWGSGGVAGAIDSVWLERSESGLSIARSTIGGGIPVGLCGSGILDAAAVFLECGLVDETGRLADGDEARRLDPSIARHLDAAARRAYVDPDAGIYLTQAELRQIQLAKAAIAAGIDVLMSAAGIRTEDIDRLYLSGGFGSSLDPETAARIGLFPKALCDRVTVAGNASGEGAAAACLSGEALRECDRIAGLCDYIELSNRAEFTRAFVERMEFGFCE